MAKLEKLGTVGASSVALTFSPDVTAKSISHALDQIYRLSGCNACGIRGIEVTFRGGDPELLQGFKDVGGVVGIQVH